MFKFKFKMNIVIQFILIQTASADFLQDHYCYWGYQFAAKGFFKDRLAKGKVVLKMVPQFLP